MSYSQVMTVAEMQDREAWLKKRHDGIGGSDAGAILGLNPWKSQFEVWQEKVTPLSTSEITEEAQEMAERLYWGTVMEEPIAKRFEELTGKKVRRKGMIRSNEYPFMLADIDREVVGENAILEVKTTSSYNKGSWDGDELPDSYYCQVQHYMAVGGYDKAYMACLVGGQTLVIKEVPRNDEDISNLIRAEQEFWDLVASKTMPTIDATPACSRYLEAKYPALDKEKEPYELDSRIESKVDRIVEIRDQIKQLSDAKKLLENELREDMQEHINAETMSYTVKYPIVRKDVFDSKAFREEYPNLYDKFIRKQEHRQFYIRKKKQQTESED